MQRTYTTTSNQTLINLALQLYGNVDAVAELMALNDFTGKMNQDSDVVPVDEVDLSASVAAGVDVIYDDTSTLRNRQALAALNGAVLADGLSVAGIPKLLDIYPEAYLAYSLRLLRDTYTGAAVRIRNASNAEADIGFTSTGEFDSAAFAAHIGAGSGAVVKWYDQSGAGRDLGQTSGTSQPLIVLDAINGKPALTFDGVNDFLSNTNLNLNRPWHLAMIGKISGGTGEQHLFGFHLSTGAAHTQYRKNRADSNVKFPAIDPAIDHTFNGKPDDFEIINLLNTGTLAQYYRNAELQAHSETIPAGQTIGRVFLGSETAAANYSQSIVPVMILWNKDMRNDIETIDNHLNTYYGIY